MVIFMKLERAMYAVGMASVFFGVYYFWQTAVGTVFGTLVMWNLSSGGAHGEMLEALYMDAVAEFGLHITLLSHVLTLLSYVLILIFSKKNIIHELSLKKLPVSGYALMPVFGAALGILVTVVLSYIPFPEAWIADYTAKSSMITEPELWVSVLVTVISAPIVEEVVFRGFVQSKLKGGFPIFASMLISSALFGLVHLSLIWIIYAGIVGFVLAYIREKYDSLIASVLVHAGFNISGVVLEYFDDIYGAVFIASGVTVAAVIVFVQCTSRYKIRFVMSKETQNT